MYQSYSNFCSMRNGTPREAILSCNLICFHVKIATFLPNKPPHSLRLLFSGYFNFRNFLLISVFGCLFIFKIFSKFLFPFDNHISLYNLLTCSLSGWFGIPSIVFYSLKSLLQVSEYGVSHANFSMTSVYMYRFICFCTVYGDTSIPSLPQHRVIHSFLQWFWLSFYFVYNIHSSHVIWIASFL